MSRLFLLSHSSLSRPLGRTSRDTQSMLSSLVTYKTIVYKTLRSFKQMFQIGNTKPAFDSQVRVSLFWRGKRDEEWDATKGPIAPCEILWWLKKVSWKELHGTCLTHSRPWQDQALSSQRGSILGGATWEQRFPGRPWRFFIISVQLLGTQKGSTAEATVPDQHVT